MNQHPRSILRNAFPNDIISLIESYFPIFNEDAIEDNEFWLIDYWKYDINWYKVTRTQRLSEDFVRKFSDRVIWCYISKYQIHIDLSFMLEFIDLNIIYWPIMFKFRNDISPKKIKEMKAISRDYDPNLFNISSGISDFLRHIISIAEEFKFIDELDMRFHNLRISIERVIDECSECTIWMHYMKSFHRDKINTIQFIEDIIDTF